MQAVWYDRQGAAQEVLRHGELPTPTPSAGEVLVRLRASAVNPADANRRAGRLHGMDFPRIIPNSDGAGWIESVGEGVDMGRIGQRVWIHFGQRGRAFGTAAEYICLPQELASELPDHVGDEEGACLGIPCMTAWCALFDGEPLAGQRVLVTGGAGAVGHYAIQLARWAGAHVVATVSSEAKAAHARRAGAHQVVDYTRQEALAALQEAAPEGFHRIVDVDVAANAELVLGIAAEGARWVGYALGSQPTASLPIARLIRANLRLRGLYLSGLPLPVRLEAQRGIGRWLREVPQAIHTIDSRFPLAETAKAHLRVEAGGKLGTVIVRCESAAD